MITSRPQTSNLLAFILFLVIAYALIVINILSINHDPEPPILNYVIAGILSPIALFITWKIVFRYKVIRIGNAQMSITYPMFRIKRQYALKDIITWKETIIKTGKTSTYKELEIKFSDKKKITMAYREYTDYEKMVKYLEQKATKQKSA